MSLMLDNKDSIIEAQVKIMVSKELYIRVIEDDVQNLEFNNIELRQHNKKLNFKLKSFKRSIPIYFGGGFLLGYLIFK